MRKRLFTSESTAIGHPDFVASAISDAILDYCVKNDPKSRCGIEVLCTPNCVTLGGEVTTKAPWTDEIIKIIVHNTIRRIGYTEEALGFWACDKHDCEKCAKVINHIHQQSPDINQGVDNAEGFTGAGDQGIMFGFANNDTEEFYPLAAQLANQLMRNYHEVQKSNPRILSPDAKSQVTIDQNTHEIVTVVIAASHKEEYDQAQIKAFIMEHLIVPTFKSFILPDGRSAASLCTDKTEYLVNTTGKFVICGPVGDAGVNGRKLAVDSYGGYARIGGGNTHGKDASKSDFTYAVYSRYLAKNLVAAGVAKQIEIQLASAIGHPQPVSICVDTFGTSTITPEAIEEVLYGMDLSLDHMIEELKLTEVSRINTNFDYTFGKVVGYSTQDEVLKHSHTWENLTLVPFFKEKFGIKD